MTKLLLDESIPRRLAKSFPSSFEIKTVQEMGWGGTKNGELLSLAGANDFVALVTADKNIEYQQNTDHLPCAIIVLDATRTRLQDLIPLIPRVVALFEFDVIGIHRVAT